MCAFKLVDGQFDLQRYKVLIKLKGKLTTKHFPS